MRGSQHAAARGAGLAAIRSGLSIWLLCIVFVAAGCAPNEHRVRVMTYNIHHGADADERPSLGDIAGLIAELDVDIVGLQEVDRHWSERSAFADQVQELSDTLDMHFVFGPIYDLPAEEEGRPRREYGLAILSRYPIAESRNYELTRLSSISSEPELRRLPGFLMAAIELAGSTLHVFNTHLDYRSDPAVRETQVAEMLDVLIPAGTRLVLLGDFNAPPGADELEPLRNVFRDAWTVSDNQESGTYPAKEPTKRIDYVFVTPDLTVDSASVPVSTASDHRPVVVELTVSR